VGPTLAALMVYPLKSGAGIERDVCEVEARGLQGDRRWMLVDEHMTFVTGRQLPALVQVRATLIEGGLLLSAPGMPDLPVRDPDGSRRVATRVWGDPVDTADAGDAAADWFSSYLKRPLRLLHADAQMQRPVDPGYAQTGDQVAFADGYPALLLSRAAADELSQRAGRALGWRRFRPNLLVDGVPAHAEDRWRRIRIGTVEFDLVKPCTRCVFTTINPDTGVAEPDGEPLSTLKSYRRGSAGITFGQNLIARSAGRIRCGDRVEVIEQML
jgi:uncharacterized protein